MICRSFNNGEVQISTATYKARLSIKKDEYHFAIFEKTDNNEWVYIATFSDTEYLRLIADVCNALVEYQEIADKIDADKQKIYTKPPL